MKINQETFKSQNRIDNISIGNLILNRDNTDFYRLISNGSVVMDFIKYIYQINNSQFFVFNQDINRWICYKQLTNNQKEFDKLYESDYLILLYPNLILKLNSDNNFYIYSGGFDYNDNLVDKSLLFIADNFKLSNGFLIATNTSQLRLFRFDIKKMIFTSEVMKTGKNEKQTTKCKLYYDNIGGLEIYDTTVKKRLLFSVNKFYKILPNLYVLKDKDKYIVYDIDQKKNLFAGSVISYIDNYITIVNYNQNEIIVFDRKLQTIKIYTWEKYKKGETKEFLKVLHWSHYE